MERTIAYIDGFNLYFGLKANQWRRFYWLDIHLLATNLLQADQKLVGTKYFTSRVSGPPPKQRRQSLYIEALETIPDLNIYYGHYQHYPWRCFRCGRSIRIPHEKMTDVNIAVEMLSDAFQNAFDTAILVSADSDLVAPISTVRRLFPEKRVIVAFPPARNSAELQKHASAWLQIGRANIANSLLPEEVTKADGFVLRRPNRWR